MPIDIQQTQQFGKLELIAKQVVEGFITGLHKSPFHGFSVEFAEHRLYNTGESTRHIDWKLYGRTDKLFVKRFEEETNLRCQLVIDTSPSMYYPTQELLKKDEYNKITFSVYAAASIMHLMKLQRDAVGLSLFADKLLENTPARSNVRHHKLLMMKLEEIMDMDPATIAQKPTSATEALHHIAETIHKRSMVIIFSDMFDSRENTSDLFNALQHLKYAKHEVILFHVTDKKLELDFDFENRPYKFRDVETGEIVKVHTSQVRDEYLKQMQQFHQDLKLKCAQYQIEMVEADVRKGFQQVLLPFLIKRHKMK